MGQVRKALSRAKTAFEKIQHRTDLIDDEVSPGREIYEIDRALKELEQRQEPRPVNTLVSEQELSGGGFEIPDGWCVTYANFDAEIPSITIEKPFTDEKKKIEVPKSLAYYLRTHYCGSAEMHNRIQERAKHSARMKIKEALGL